ncbi:MAG: HDOD domain-containing protein [Acidobacteria bacterium]|nr:HDOD domain-containing protein [Acidobacteriota bacterium]
MTKRRILFVDDEAPVLESLRNLLRKYRTVWDLVFALSGAEALELLEANPCDVVVADMRMPGMDGAALLAEVKARHPATVRLVLSGHADRDAIVRALPVAHQYLSKPCDADVLRAVIERTCALQTRLNNPTIGAVVGRLDQVPSAPQVYWDLTALLERDDVALAQVARLVEQDPAMVAKLLQLVNSAYFGLARRVTSAEQAVTYLGVQLVRSLALSIQVFDSKPITTSGFSVDRLQRTSLWTGRVARRIASAAGVGDDAFTAGLLRDLGQLVLARAMPDQFVKVAAELAGGQRPIAEVESEGFGATHADVGAYLIGVWGLPVSIIEAVAYHHEPRQASPESLSLVRAIHIADALVEWASRGGTDAEATGALDVEFLERTGGMADLAKWCEFAQAEVGLGAEPALGVAS